MKLYQCTGTIHITHFVQIDTYNINFTTCFWACCYLNKAYLESIINEQCLRGKFVDSYLSDIKEAILSSCNYVYHSMLPCKLVTFG